MVAKVKSRKTIIYSIGLVCILALIVFFVSSQNNVLTSDEVFNNIDFNSDYSHINIFRYHAEGEVGYTKFIPTDTEKAALLKALEASKFEVLPDSTFNHDDYRVDITLNKRYELYFDKTNKILKFVYEEDNDSDHRYYQFSGDSEFLTLLVDLTK